MAQKPVLSFLLVFVAASSISTDDGEKMSRFERYNGYHLLLLHPPEDSSVLSFLSKELPDEHGHVIFWSPLELSYSIQLAVSYDSIERVLKVLASTGTFYRLLIGDIGAYLRHSTDPTFLPRVFPDANYTLDWNAYYSYDDVMEFLDAMESQFPEMAEKKIIGKSFEGIHAREWISPAVAAYIIRELLEHSETRPQYTNELNIHFIPIVNPDGYEYSRREGRSWRKSRVTLPNSPCRGVDLNRNFDVHFGESGVSDDECNEDYPGSFPFSENETLAVKNYFQSLNPIPIFSLSLHAAAGELLWPWAYKTGHPADNHDEMHTLGQAAMAALNRRHNQRFSCGNAASQTYEASGISMDWYYQEGSRFSYTLELRDNGHLFYLPSEFIKPSAEETWAAVKVFLDHILTIPRQMSGSVGPKDGCNETCLFMAVTVLVFGTRNHMQ